MQASQEYPTLNCVQPVAINPTPLYELIVEHAEPQLIEGLLHIAAALRVHNERHGRKLFDGTRPVGSLYVPAQSDLSMKDGCDKIIHADDLRFGGGTGAWDVKEFDRQLPGPYVIKTAILTGRRSGREWKADLDLWAFCEVATSITRIL